MKINFKSKKRIAIAIFVVIIGILVIIKVRWNESKYNTYTITTKYQDKFFIKEEVVETYPDYFYDVEIYDANLETDKKLIIKLESVQTLQKKIKALYISDDVRSYLVSNIVISKSKNQDNFKAIEIEEFSHLDYDEYSYLIPVAREVFLDNWEWAKSVAEFLLKSKDIYTITAIKRYANGDFTDEELQRNKYVIYGKERIKEFSSSLLIKYNIDF